MNTISTINKLSNAAVKFNSPFAFLSEQTSYDSKTDLPRRILHKLFQYRRLHSDAAVCAANPCNQCLSLHLPKVFRFIIKGEPVHFLLPAFPAKSPNTKKVLGKLPDMAEELALRFLQTVCDEIKKIYSPGALITICSDGRVFSDLVGVSDNDVTEYGEALKLMLRRIDAPSLNFLSMENITGFNDYSYMRGYLLSEYADSLMMIKERVRTSEHHKLLFNGIHRFLFEDSVAIETSKSRTRVRNESKELAYKVIQRSEAWGRLIGDYYPMALRLSIHPQNPHSSKIGIKLGDTDDTWLTPWHSVAVKQNGDFKFMRRNEAELIGARVVRREERPGYYEIGAM